MSSSKHRVAASPSACRVRRCPRRRDRRGQSLIEFAFVALVLYLLVAVVLDFGRGINGAQVIQSAADLAARELSRTPLPATDTFTAAMQDPRFQAVYSEDFLAIDVTAVVQGGGDLLEHLDSLNMPPVNKALLPLMFVSSVGGSSILRYPGALVSSTSSTAQSPYTVMVPVVTSPPGTSPESIAWHRVLEPIYPAGVTDENVTAQTDPFSVTYASGSSSSVVGGIISIRINYPFQAAAMSGFDQNNNPMIADDSGVNPTNAVPNGGSPVIPNPQNNSDYAGTYGGAYGLGEQGAMATTVRPFRRVISAQAIYRREIFSN